MGAGVLKSEKGGYTRAVASQNRGDFDSKTGLGIDRKVSGFAIYDIYGSLAFSENFGLKFGVNNILYRSNKVQEHRRVF